jgi:hypothetical protein
MTRTPRFFADSISQHHGRTGQHSGCEFEIVQIFAAEVLSKARIQSLSARSESRPAPSNADPESAPTSASGWAREAPERPQFGSDRLDRLEDASVFYAGKVIEDLGLLAQRSVGSDGLAGNRNRTGGAQVLGKNKLEQAAFQSQQRDFGVLHTKHFGQNHADIQRRDAFAQHRS